MVVAATKTMATLVGLADIGRLRDGGRGAQKNREFKFLGNFAAARASENLAPLGLPRRVPCTLRW
jgi:hypothetical protein